MNGLYKQVAYRRPGQCEFAVPQLVEVVLLAAHYSGNNCIVIARQRATRKPFQTTAGRTYHAKLSREVTATRTTRRHGKRELCEISQAEQPERPHLQQSLREFTASSEGCVSQRQVSGINTPPHRNLFYHRGASLALSCQSHPVAHAVETA